MSVKKWLVLLAPLLLAAAGCRSEAPPPTVDPLVLPSVAAPGVPQETATPTDLPASPTPPCSDDLRFLDDISISDGTLVEPGASLDKRWLVQNPSSCNWDSAYSLRLITGSPLGAVSPQPLYPAVAGSEAEIRILYAAPVESGVYRSAWQAHNPQGVPFGDPIFIEIIVP
jgi:hypothetical protein